MADANTSAQLQSSATLAQRLQARLDAGANLDELLKLAADAGVSLDPALTQQMVDYVAQGGKGAQFLPGVGGETTPAVPEVAPSPASQTPLGAAIAGAADVYAAEPSLGLDPANRSELEKLGILGKYLYAPLGDIGAAAYTTAQAGLMGAAQGTGQLLENIGVLPAVEALTSVKQTPQSFAEQALGIADFATMKYPFATIPELPSRTAPTLPRVAEVAAEVTPLPAVKLPSKTNRVLPTGKAPLETFSGETVLKHGRDVRTAGPLTGFSTPNKVNADLRYGTPEDAGGVLGSDGVYLASDPKWFTDMSQLYLPNVYDVAAPFDNALVLTPENIGSLPKRGKPWRGRDIAEWAKRKGYDGVVLEGFDDLVSQLRASEKPVGPISPEGLEFTPKGLRKKDFPQEFSLYQKELKQSGIALDPNLPDVIPADDAARMFLKRMNVDPEIGQDQVFAMQPERLRVLGPAQTLEGRVSLRSSAANAPKTIAVNEMPTLTPAEGKAALEGMAEQGMTQPLPKLDVSEKVANFASDYLNAGGLTRPADMPFSEFFYRHVKAGTVPEDQFRELVQKYNLDDQDVMELFTGTRQGLGDAARTMQRFSVASRYVPQEAGELAKLGVEQAADLSLWQRLTNTYRGALVSNMATTMRNNISSLARVPIDVATNLADAAINTAANPFRAEKVGVNPMDAFAVITDRFNPAQNKRFYDQLRNIQPGINTELMATYAADVARVTKKDAFSKAEKAIDTVNLFNRVSETATRKAIFPVYLRREATRLGYNFDELVDAERLNELPEEAYQNALNATLDYTYSGRPKRDSFADLFVRAVEKGGLPLATVMPFPRFMVNAMKFQFDHSPAGFARLLSKAEREKFAKGDTSALSKAMVGSALLYAAYEFRNSENAGEVWYEAKTKDGKTFDLRPFFPAAPYLLVADIIKRAQDGSLDLAFASKDILQGLTGAQFRAGGGLYVADELIRDLTGAGTALEKAKNITKQWLANLGGGFLVPFQQFKDFYAQYNPEEAVYRDAKDSALGTALRAVPGAQRALGVPEAELPTREGASITVDPALRQLLGVTVREEKNFLESEIDRLGLKPYELGPNTGDPEMDRLINRDLGIIAERGVLPLIQSGQYKQLDDVRKVQAIRDVYTKARDVAMQKFEAENPELALIKSLKRRNRTEKILINRAFEEKTGKTAEAFLRQLREAPMVRSQEQYDALPKGAKFTDPGDYKVYEKK